MTRATLITTHSSQICPVSWPEGLNMYIKHTSVPTVSTVLRINTLWTSISPTVRFINHKARLFPKRGKTQPSTTRTLEKNFPFHMSCMLTLKHSSSHLKTKTQPASTFLPVSAVSKCLNSTMKFSLRTFTLDRMSCHTFTSTFIRSKTPSVNNSALTRTCCH